MNRKIRINFNPAALVKIAGILSNAVVLGSNIYMLASGFSNNIANRRRDSNIKSLQLTSEVASSIAGIASVVDNISQKHNAQNAENL